MTAQSKLVEGERGEQQTVRVALIEDNPDSRRSLSLILKAWGFQASQAEEGVSGLAMILEEQPAIALIDIGLPGMDGLSIAREVRIKMGERIRLIAITGYGQPEDRARSHEAGFDFHLVKPVDFQVLHMAMSNSDTPAVEPPPKVSTSPARPACPACGGALVEIRGKLQCSVCRVICETCCEGGRG